MKQGEFAACRLTVVPIRAHHDDTSEMVTQLLFGEAVKILNSHNQWLEIESLHDNYKGWVDHKQLFLIAEKEALSIQQNTFYLQENNLLLHTPWGSQRILQGSPVCSVNKKFTLGELNFEWETLPSQHNNKSIIDLSNDYLNAPYLWGGRTPYGIDCSGLTQTIFHQKGFALQRDASQQVLQGNTIDFSDHQPGDLAFFASEKTGKINHVGIILKHAQIIHAHGRVRIDTIDTRGIYNKKEDIYSHRLTAIQHYKI